MPSPRCTILLVALLVTPVACGGDDDGGGDGAHADAAHADAAGSDGGVTVVSVTSFVGTVQSNLVFVAAQDGDSEWSVLSGTDGDYSFPVASGRYGLAYVCITQETDVAIEH